MDVKKLVIIALEGIAESTLIPSATALAARHLSKGREKPIVLVLDEYIPIPGTVADWTEPLKKCEKELAEIRGSMEGDLGVYVSAHGTSLPSYAIGGFDANKMAILFAAIKFNALRKVSFVACNVERAYLVEFCKTLQMLTMFTPMVAGYRQFVSPLGSHDLEKAAVYDVGRENEKEGEKHKVIPPDARRKEDMGKKVVSSSSTGMTTNWYKKGNKVFVTSNDPAGHAVTRQIKSSAKILVKLEGGEVVDVDPSKWGKW